MGNSNTCAQNAGSGSTEFPWKWSLKDLEQNKKHGHTVFSCFSCGGGSSMGYKIAGYDVIGNCEIDPSIMKVYKANFNPRFSYLMDIRDFAKLPDEEIPAELRNLDILDGSPPCSVFSMAGLRQDGWGVEKKFREGQASQRLDDLFFHFLDVADRLQPKVVIAENVKGLVIGQSKGWVNQIFKKFDDIGYVVQLFLLNSAVMGVPQRRERVFFIARRKDLDYPKLSLSFNSKPIPFREVREEKGKYLGPNVLSQALMKYRKPTDRDLSDINKRARKKTGMFTSPICRDNEPVPTVTSGGYMFRMCDGLHLTDRDISNCQTFPQDYDYLDQDVKYVCGMSVPPVMMARIAEQVHFQWLND